MENYFFTSLESAFCPALNDAILGDSIINIS